MNNITQSTAFLADNSGILTPRLVLNADPTSDAVLTKRKGYSKLYSLTNPHSLSKNCSLLFCVADNKLCKLSREGFVEIAVVDSSSMSYAEIGNYVYMSSPTWTGKYNLLTNSLEDWGISAPATPGAYLVSGSLPPGKYKICYTKQSDGQISGNGAILEIEFAGDSQDIVLTNYIDSYLCWITDTDGKDFYLADVQDDFITHQYYNIPLQSLFVIPPPRMSIINYIFGRIWGIKGKKLYYSEPGAFSWFKEANSFSFPDKLIMLVSNLEAIFVASGSNTWALVGKDPKGMRLNRVGNGSIIGCSEAGEFQQSGQEIPTWRHKSILPIWLSAQGLMVGNEQHYVTNLTENKLDFTIGARAATLRRKVNGQAQILITMPVAGGILGDTFKLGRAFIPGPLVVKGSGGVILNGSGSIVFE